METIADRVKAKLALFPALDQHKLAARCGTTQASISRLLSGKIDSPEYIYELSLALVTSVQWLKTGIEDVSLEFMLKYKPFIDAYESAPDEIKQIIQLQLKLGESDKKISATQGISGSKGSGRKVNGDK